jgi:succinate dehydrogenase / fumarate reductase cytochrome b subunit
MADNPLSPHLQVYRPQLTSILSITHRATGVFLSVGTVILLYWLVAAALGPHAYIAMQACLASLPAQIVLAGAMFSFYFHLLNGVRHLFWDIGWGFELATAYKSGYAVIIGALALSGLTWACVVAQGGGA